MSENNIAKPGISRVVGELCVLIGSLLLQAATVSAVFDWSIYFLVIGGTLAVLGFLVLRFNAQGRQNKWGRFDGLLLAGIVAIVVGELCRSWLLLLGGFILAASPISPQLAETARSVWSYLVKSYREISRDGARPRLK